MKHIILVNHRSQVSEKFTGITRYTFSLVETLIDRNRFDFVLVTTWSKERLPQKIAEWSRQGYYGRQAETIFLEYYPANF